METQWLMYNSLLLFLIVLIVLFLCLETISMSVCGARVCVRACAYACLLANRRACIMVHAQVTTQAVTRSTTQSTATWLASRPSGTLSGLTWTFVPRLCVQVLLGL